jgi:hypothetical protein
MHFLKLIIFAIIFEFLSCFGIHYDPGRGTSVELLSDSMEIAVTKCAYHYKSSIDQATSPDILF